MEEGNSIYQEVILHGQRREGSAEKSFREVWHMVLLIYGAGGAGVEVYDLVMRNDRLRRKFLQKRWCRKTVL